MKRRLLGLAVISIFFMGFAPNRSENSKVLKTEMSILYQSLAKILPLYLDSDRFYNVKNKTLVESKLEAIHTHSKQIKKFLSTSDEELKILSRSLEHSSNLARINFKRELRGQSNYYVGEVLDTCFACHSSRKSSNDSQLDLLKHVNLADLAPNAKAKLMTISRQFSQAMDEYEDIILKHQLDLSEIIHFDPFLKYLVLGLRVRPDVPRVAKTLNAAIKRPLPQSIKQDIRIWIKSLEDVRSKEWSQGDLLQQVQRLMQKGKLVMDFPKDQSGAVYYLEASRRLKEFLANKDVDKKRKAHAYLLLGKSEMVIGRSFLGLEARRYFEITIRLQPKTGIAQDAFKIYENSVLFGYTGSSGMHLPEDEAAKLEELRQKAY